MPFFPYVDYGSDPHKIKFTKDGNGLLNIHETYGAKKPYDISINFGFCTTYANFLSRMY